MERVSQLADASRLPAPASRATAGVRGRWFYRPRPRPRARLPLRRDPRVPRRAQRDGLCPGARRASTDRAGGRGGGDEPSGSWTIKPPSANPALRGGGAGSGRLGSWRPAPYGATRTPEKSPPGLEPGCKLFDVPQPAGCNVTAGRVVVPRERASLRPRPRNDGAQRSTSHFGMGELCLLAPPPSPRQTAQRPIDIASPTLAGHLPRQLYAGDKYAGTRASARSW